MPLTGTDGKPKGNLGFMSKEVSVQVRGDSALFFASMVNPFRWCTR